jgi:hypothetical protein
LTIVAGISPSLFYSKKKFTHVKPAHGLLAGLSDRKAHLNFPFSAEQREKKNPFSKQMAASLCSAETV